METFGEYIIDDIPQKKSSKIQSCKSFSATSPCSVCQRLSDCPFVKIRNAEKQRIMEETRKYSMVGLV